MSPLNISDSMQSQLKKVEEKFLKKTPQRLPDCSGYLLTAWRADAGVEDFSILEYLTPGRFEFLSMQQFSKEVELMSNIMAHISQDSPLAVILQYTLHTDSWTESIYVDGDAVHYSNDFSNIDNLADLFHPLGVGP